MTSSETATPTDAAGEPPRPRWRHPVVLVLGGLAALALLAIIALWTVQRGQVLPNTEVVGIPVGGLTAEEVGSAIDEVVRGRETDEVVFTFEDERFGLSPDEVGYRIDEEATIEAALGRGRGNLLTDLPVRVTSLWRTADIGLTERIDDDRIEATVDDLAAAVDRETTTGAIDADPDTLEVITEPPQGAAQVRRDEVVADLTDALRRPGPDELVLAADVDPPPIDPADAATVAAQLEEAIAEPLELRAEGMTLTVDRRQLAELATVEVTDGGQLELVVTEVAVSEILEAAARQRFDVTAVSASYTTSRTPPESFSDSGSTSWSPVSASASTVEGRDGRDFDPAQAAQRLTEALRAAERTAETQLVVTEPRLPNARAQDLRPTHLLGTFTTSYTEGQTRVANIQRLADVVDDTLILPGEQFSINDISGQRTCEKGYEPAGTIVQGELVDTCGGGVSQFGTTAFNAAFFSGVQLDQWQAHSFYIARYPEGREATLSFPQLDVRFTNDSDGAIVVRASFTDTTVTVSLYGRPHADVVEASHGSRSDPQEPTTDERTTSDLPAGETQMVQEEGAPGFTVEVVRQVSYTDGSRDAQTIRTTYRPQNGIRERGTG